MSPVKQVRYSGQDGRVLVDVGALNDGDVVGVPDDLADTLVATFPDDYSIVEPVEEPEVEEPKAEPAPTKAAKKAAEPADDTTTTDTAAS
jgi:hypothetical protein